jgi:hypothetical protein
MVTPAERITFIVTRGVVALALVGAGMFCISKGITFWSMPRQDASQLGLDVLGLHLTAGGLGGVIFGAGIAICFFAYKTAPKGLESTDKQTINPPLIVTPTGAPTSTSDSQEDAKPRGGRGGGGGGIYPGGGIVEHSDKVFNRRETESPKTHI